MTPQHRVASIAGALTLALTATAQAATIRLIPLTPPAVGTSVNACTTPYAPAAVSNAVSPDLPAIAAGQHVTGITEVRIALDARGRLAEHAVLTSSGNRWIDRAALQAARQSTYRSEIRDCARVGGIYAFAVDFTQ